MNQELATSNDMYFGMQKSLGFYVGSGVICHWIFSGCVAVRRILSLLNKLIETTSGSIYVGLFLCNSFASMLDI